MFEFACGISGHPDILVEMVCEMVASTFQKANLSDEEKQRYYIFLHSIEKEVAENPDTTVRPFSNRFITVYKQDDESTIEHFSMVYLYVKDSSRDELSIKPVVYHNPDTDKKVAYSVEADDDASFKAASAIVQKVSASNEMIISHVKGLDLLSQVSYELTEMFGLKMNPRHVAGLYPSSTSDDDLVLEGEVKLWGNQNDKTKHFFSLVSEILKFQKISVSTLEIDGPRDENTDRTWSELDFDALRIFSKLKVFEVWKLALPSAVFDRIAEGLYKYEKTCLPLEKLILVKTKMSATSLQQFVQPTRLGNLRVLNLGETDLRGCLESLLGTGYPNLEELVLSSTKLKNEDVNTLTNVISQCLPKLKRLYLDQV